MSLGVLYGIGVGPGDPELISVKGAKLISNTKQLFVPIARVKAKSVAFDIVKNYVTGETKISELVFPMVTDKAELEKSWNESATKIASHLKTGENACFITLGDPFLYSTYIYLLRALEKILPTAKIVTIPGITAFSLVAALTSFPIGEGKEKVTIVPTSDDLKAVSDAIKSGGTVVLMKVGKRLQGILDILDELDVIDDAIFVANAGMPDQQIETDLKKLYAPKKEMGYLSTILIKVEREAKL